MTTSAHTMTTPMMTVRIINNEGAMYINIDDVISALRICEIEPKISIADAISDFQKIKKDGEE